MKATSTLLFLSLLVSAGSGCYSTWEISHDTLRGLDGYRAPGKRVVVSTERESVEFDQKSMLLFENSSKGTSQATGPFAGIQINGPMLTGHYIDAPQSKPLEIDLRLVSGLELRVKKFSPGKTAGLVLGLGVGLPGAVIGILAAPFLRNFRY